MGAFMFIQARVTKPEQFLKYAKGSAVLIEKFGGRYRSRMGEVEQLDGQPDDRKIIVIEWPSMDAARSYWNSDEYQELKKFREGAAEIDIYLVEITGD